MTGQSWLGLEAEGMKTQQVISKVVTGHKPNPEQFLGDNSVTIYIRQDPFRETVYISYSSLLTQLGQLAGVVLLLYFIGFVLTAFWAYRFYNVSLIKQLYTVKHTSAGREFVL